LGDGDEKAIPKGAVNKLVKFHSRAEELLIRLTAANSTSKAVEYKVLIPAFQIFKAEDAENHYTALIGKVGEWVASKRGPCNLVQDITKNGVRMCGDLGALCEKMEAFVKDANEYVSVSGSPATRASAPAADPSN
jgi:hypothetical protein